MGDRKCPDCNNPLARYERRCLVCREKRELEMDARYRALNIKRIRKYANEWRKKHPEKVVAARRVYLDQQKRMKAELLEDMILHPRKYLNKVQKGVKV